MKKIVSIFSLALVILVVHQSALTFFEVDVSTKISGSLKTRG